MAVNKSTRETLSRPISFRPLQSHREILEMFAREDGHEGSLTPILRDATDLYIHTRIRHGRAAVREHPVHPDQEPQ